MRDADAEDHGASSPIEEMNRPQGWRPPPPPRRSSAPVVCRPTNGGALMSPRGAAVTDDADQGDDENEGDDDDASVASSGVSYGEPRRRATVSAGVRTKRSASEHSVGGTSAALQEDGEASERYMAAVGIQARWRGAGARRKASAERTARVARTSAVAEASVRVQSLQRRQRASAFAGRLARERQDRAATVLETVGRRRLARGEARRRRVAEALFEARSRESHDLTVTTSVRRVARGATNLNDRRGRLANLLRRTPPSPSTTTTTTTRVASPPPPPSSSASPSRGPLAPSGTGPAAAAALPRVEGALPTAQVASVVPVATAEVGRVESYRAERDGSLAVYATAVPIIPEALPPDARVAPAVPIIAQLPPDQSSASPARRRHASPDGRSSEDGRRRTPTTNGGLRGYPFLGPTTDRPPTEQRPSVDVLDESEDVQLAINDPPPPPNGHQNNHHPATISPARRPPPLPSTPPPDVDRQQQPATERAVLRMLYETPRSAALQSLRNNNNNNNNNPGALAAAAASLSMHHHHHPNRPWNMDMATARRAVSFGDAPSSGSPSSSSSLPAAPSMFGARSVSTPAASSSSGITEARIATIADMAANGASAEARRGALALLGDEYRASPPRGPGTAAAICAILALVRPLYDEDTSVRIAAVRCAQSLGSLELAQFALDDEASAVRCAVVEALGDVFHGGGDGDGDDLFEAARRPGGGALSLEQQRLVTLIIALMKALEDVALDDDVLVKAAKALRDAVLQTRIETPLLLSAPLEKGMEAQRVEVVRIALVVAAGELRAVDSLSKIAIFDSAVNVRRAAVEMLGWNEAALELKDLVLAGDNDAHVRADALEWLERLDDAQGLATRGLLGDRSAELRARAAHHLGDVAARRLMGCAPVIRNTTITTTTTNNNNNNNSNGTAAGSSSFSSTRRSGLGLPCEAPPAVADVSSFRVRALATMTSSRWPPPWYDGVIGALGRALTSDVKEGVRGAAAQQLARLRGVRWLGNGLKDAHTPLRLRCVDLLGDLGEYAPEAVEELGEALGDEDEAVRRAAIERLGRLGDPHRALDRRATKDAAERNRLIAAQWLAKLQRAAALAETALVDAASAPLRAQAARSLEQLFAAALKRAATAAAAPSPGTDLVLADMPVCRTALLVRLGDTERRVRVAAARALEPVGEPLWHKIIKGDGNDCRRLGTDVLSAKGTAVLVSILCDAAELPDRIAAAEALAARKQAPRLATEALCACCAARVLPWTLRVAALRAIYTLASTPAVAYPPTRDDAQLDAALRASFADADHQAVRAAAAHAAGAARCTGSALEHGLLRHLRPANESVGTVRAACAARLSHFGPESKAAATALLDALRDRDMATRDAAAAAFGAFRAAAFATTIVAKAAVILRDRDAVKRYATPGEYLEQGSHVARAAAARGLGALRSEAALDALHEALAADKEPLVRRAVCCALGEIRHPRSLKPLLAPLRDKKNAAVVEAASHAVANIDYAHLSYLRRGERVLLHGPIFKRKQCLWTSFKALVLTDTPRLFYVDANTLKSKDCDVNTFVIDADDATQARSSSSSSSSAAAAAAAASSSRRNIHNNKKRSKDLAFTVPGQGRVRVTLLFGDAVDWVYARDEAIAQRRQVTDHGDGDDRLRLVEATTTTTTTGNTGNDNNGLTILTSLPTPTTPATTPGGRRSRNNNNNVNNPETPTSATSTASRPEWLSPAATSPARLYSAPKMKTSDGPSSSLAPAADQPPSPPPPSSAASSREPRDRPASGQQQAPSTRLARWN